MGEFILLAVGGLAIGMMGGLLGLGGGIVLMPLLRFGLGVSTAEAAGTCIVAVFFTTLGGSYRHLRLGHLRLRSILPIMISGCCAAAGFSLLFPRLASRAGWLDLGIGLVFLLVASRMIIEGLPRIAPRSQPIADHGRFAGRIPLKLSIGVVSGALPGLLGIGTGGILVPTFTLLLKTSMRAAAAASLTCYCCNAAVSAGIKCAQGYVDIHFGIPLSLGTLIGANLGAVINHRAPPTALKLVFGIVFLGVAMRFILAFALA